MLLKPVREYYHEKQHECDEKIKGFERQINIYSFLRLFVLITGVFLFYQTISYDLIWLSFLLVLLLILGFAWLVAKQSRFQKQADYFRNLGLVHSNELNSLDRNSTMYSEGSAYIDDLHPYSSDLDIFGKGSLFGMLNRCSTQGGNAKLAGWLMKSASPDMIRERQAAVIELGSNLIWKHHFQAVLLFANKSTQDQSAELFKFLTISLYKPASWLIVYVRWIPYIFLILAISSWFLPSLLILLSALIIFNLILMQNYNSRILKTDSMIGKMSRVLNHFSEAISAVSDENWMSPMCRKLAEDLKGKGDKKLSGQIKRFSLLISHLNFGLTGVGAILNAIIVWNIRQLFAIENWKKENQEGLKQAFDVLASFESLISLSSLNTNYPEWCFAEINEQELYTLKAKDIGHPLIPSQQRVDNDYILDNELKIDIITGSNMAGKSTFLRTLGINSVLALSGAPSCASSMEVSNMLIFTYMRIRDSLNESTSTFKAELDRLQALIKMLDSSGKVYFLIDEMLRGTNSVDKYLGSKAVIEKLISQKAVGIVATHDLQIAGLEQNYPDYIRNYYFDIQMEANEMRFDYKLKKGECKTFNASLLLQRIGIYPESQHQQD
ncbi:MAG: DNA mismatch repair protein MutS [Daejeonella sp.]|uniref:MutS-related protein n=1 Tax=Daejeonella sp. TaxID=2805397 RepID=UPI002736B0F6|nr:DNA mismatch repair protein MutS [Daejeonella sp.]MDP3468861.1 DNA mismatch repair protein MutS [Daejeonella sp.]